MQMRFSICHETHYRYSSPVTLAAHVLRLTPRADGAHLHWRRLTVDPMPGISRDTVDRYGNTVTELAFEGLTDHLRIESRFEIETRAAQSPPLPPLLKLPWPPGGAPSDYLPPTEEDASVRTFAEGLASQSGWDAAGFLERLNATLFARMDRGIRAGGGAQAPAYTLATGKGACRDLTVLFMAACRSLGVAARFVSGYQAYAETPDGRRHLHAWPEVFLPGLGWRGFDPMHGLSVTDGHVALCAAPEQAETMPVEGGFFGAGVTSSLTYDVRITVTP
jgi:transglutaminase-like putative cysteine protease